MKTPHTLPQLAGLAGTCVGARCASRDRLVRRRALVAFTFAAILVGSAGCYVDEPTPRYVVATDDGYTDLVEVSPGIEVVADYGQPIFFVDNYYWLYLDGFWYWSTWYGGGWARARPPVWGARIPHPERYVHYRPAGWAPHVRVNGGYAAHDRYHATHPARPPIHARPPVRGGGRRR